MLRPPPETALPCGHNPFMFFKNINTNFAYVTNHVRPFSELSQHLAESSVAHFNFICPNVTNDMHDSVGGVSTRILGDNWLAREVPKILNSAAFTNGGVLFIAWDEGSLGGSSGESDGPLGLIVLSPLAKGRGYVNTIHYTHSSTLRTFQDILGVRPYLADASNTVDLSDLFLPTPKISEVVSVANGWQVSVTNLMAGRSHQLQSTTELDVGEFWQTLASITPTQSKHIFTHTNDVSEEHRYYRVVLVP